MPKYLGVDFWRIAVITKRVFAWKMLIILDLPIIFKNKRQSLRLNNVENGSKSSWVNLTLSKRYRCSSLSHANLAADIAKKGVKHGKGSVLNEQNEMVQRTSHYPSLRIRHERHRSSSNAVEIAEIQSFRPRNRLILQKRAYN